MPTLDPDPWQFQDSNASASLSLQSSRVQVPQSLQLLSWGWEHGWGFWGLFFSAEETGLGSEVEIAGRLHHPGSLMRRGSWGEDSLGALAHLATVPG